MTWEWVVLILGMWWGFVILVAVSVLYAASKEEAKGMSSTIAKHLRDGT